MKRRPIHASADTEKFLVVTCNDGTIWSYSWGGKKWAQIPEIPQPKLPENECEHLWKKVYETPENNQHMEVCMNCKGARCVEVSPVFGGK